jgi:uncharacterized protein (TIGR02246 family)
MLPIAAVAALGSGWAQPASAEQLTDREASKIAEHVLEAWNKGFRDKDAAALGAQYIEDTNEVGPQETLVGRAAIIKDWEGNWKNYAPNPDELVEVRAVGDDAVWVALRWSGILQGPKGPENLRGLTARVYVRDGDSWKIRSELWNVTPSTQLSEQDARQIAEQIEHVRYKASQAKDAGALASLQTEDGIRVTGGGQTLIGRDAYEKWLAKILPNWDADLTTIDQVKVVSPDVIVATGSWSGVWHGEKGPEHETGRWTNVEVRVRDAWKTSASMVSNTPQQ